jgi:N-acetylglucosamine-6-sulfatase
MLYETDLLARHATQWLHNITAEKPGQPFFAYIAPHGPHGAAIPAPQHRAAFPNVTAPRGAASWNYSAQDHHGLVRTQPPVR